MKALTATDTCSGLRDSGRAVELTCTTTAPSEGLKTTFAKSPSYTAKNTCICPIIILECTYIARVSRSLARVVCILPLCAAV